MYALPMAASKLQKCSWVVSRLYGPQRLKYLLSGFCRESLLTPREEGRPRGGRWKPEDWMIFKERSWDFLLCLHKLQLKPDDELCMIKETTQMIFCLQRKCNPGWSNRRLLRQDALKSGRDENSLPALCSPHVSLRVRSSPLKLWAHSVHGLPRNSVWSVMMPWEARIWKEPESGNSPSHFHCRRLTSYRAFEGQVVSTLCPCLCSS